MHRSHLVLLAVIMALFSACSNDDGQDDAVATEQSAATASMKNGGFLDGIHYNQDSMAIEAMAIYYEVQINTICNDMLKALIEKDKKDEIKTAYHTITAFVLSKDKLDSLKYFGITQDMISSTDPSKAIYLAGEDPYMKRGMYEVARVNIKDYKNQFPVLFKYGRQMFMNDRKPKLMNLTPTDQTTKHIDYSAEFQLSDEQTTYVYFTVISEHQALKIELNKADD